MKKYFSIFCIIFLMFICFPQNAMAEEEEDYFVCLYDKAGVDGGYQAALHVVNDTVVLDMYNAAGVINAESRIKKDVIYGDGVIPTPGIKVTKLQYVSPKFLTIRCPQTLCEDDDDRFIWLDEDGCANGTSEYTYVRRLLEFNLNSVSEALLFKWGSDNPSIVQYTSILDGSCPSDIGVFKLFQIAYDLIKIAAPLMLVVFATIDLAKATTASDDGMIKKAQKHCLKRVAGAVIVFLSFVIVEMIIGLTSGGSEIMDCISQIIN